MNCSGVCIMYIAVGMGVFPVGKRAEQGSRCDGWGLVESENRLRQLDANRTGNIGRLRLC